MVRSSLLVLLHFVASSSIRLSSPHPNPSSTYYHNTQHNTSFPSHSHVPTSSRPPILPTNTSPCKHSWIHTHLLPYSPTTPTTSLTHLYFHRRRRSSPLRTIQTRRKGPRVLQIPPRKRQRVARLQSGPSCFC